MQYNSPTMASSKYLMMMMMFGLIVLLTSPAASTGDIIELPSEEEVASYCESWKFAVETDGARPWRLVDPGCLNYVLRYISRGQYDSDFAVIARYALSFADTVHLSGDGRDAWIFDVDDTLLSSIGYFEDNGYGIKEPVTKGSFVEWIEKGTLPPLKISLSLYNEIKKKGFTIFILTGRDERLRNVTETNLFNAGYSGWQRLLMKDAEYEGKLGTEYKSKRRSELVKEGYIIHGNVGDQWYDLNGFALAQRSFKVPNPIYGPSRLD